MDEMGIPREPKALSDLMRDIVHESERKSSVSSRISKAWYAANGDIERKHTVGVFLKKEEDSPGTLIVYIDSRALLQDFMTNKLIYLARLEAQGIELDDIDFRMSKYRKGEVDTTGMYVPEPEPDLPELSEEEMEEVRKMCSTLPEKIRPIVSDAVISSMRRQRLEGTDIN